MSSLIERMAKIKGIPGSSVLSKSKSYNDIEPIKTDLPILNMAFSGDIDGGLVPGITIIAGDSKTFKTLISLYCLKAFLKKYPDGICLFYDTEFGATPAYFKTFDIDPNRVFVIEPNNVEEMKFDIVKRLEEISPDDKVFILNDSLGGLASKKEVNDAANENSAADMSRAREIRSMLRIVTPHITKKKIPFVIINHVYKTMEMYSKTVIPGGTAVTYYANQVFIITKAQEKDGTELAGYKFTINIDKSRYVKEKAKFPFIVTYKGGINKWSSLFELALEAGYINKASTGWYNMIDFETGEVYDTKLRQKQIESDNDFFEALLKQERFAQFVRDKYKLSELTIEELEAAEEYREEYHTTEE